MSHDIRYNPLLAADSKRWLANLQMHLRTQRLLWIYSFRRADDPVCEACMSKADKNKHVTVGRSGLGPIGVLRATGSPAWVRTLGKGATMSHSSRGPAILFIQYLESRRNTPNPSISTNRQVMRKKEKPGTERGVAVLSDQVEHGRTVG